MEVTVCHPRDLGPGDVAQWQQLQAGCGALANPFASVTFARTMALVDERARVALVTDGDQLVGVLPFRRCRSGRGRPPGAGVSGCEALIHVPEADVPWTEVLARCGLSTWQFDNLVAAERPLGSAATSTHVIDLHRGFESYTEEVHKRSKRFLNDLARKRRRLERDIGEATLAVGLDAPAMAKLVEWKSAQYRRSGLPDPFSRPWVRELLERLAETVERDCTGRLSVLRARDEVLAVDFSLHSESVYAGWFVTYNPRFSAYSPGTIRWLLVLEQLAALGISIVDLGPGDQDYKYRMATGTAELYRGMLARPSVRASVYRATRTSRQQVTDFVLTHDRLRSTVRSTLRATGRLRTRLTPGARLEATGTDADRGSGRHS